MAREFATGGGVARTVRSGARLSAAAGLPALPGDAGTRSLVTDAEHWVATDAVRQAIGAWAYTLPAGERRPGPAEVREAVAVAGAIRECALDGQRTGWGVPLRRHLASDTAEPVAFDPTDVADRTGLSERSVAQALDVLRRARIVQAAGSGRGASGALDASVLSPQPCVARLAWAEGRDRLRAVGASLAPALAVWREIAAAVGPYADGTSAPPVRLSVRALEERTEYGRSTVAEALGALERARLVDLELRAGRTARVELRAASFGRPDLPPLGTAAVMPAALPPALPPTLPLPAQGTPTQATPGRGAPPREVPSSVAPVVDAARRAVTPVAAVTPVVSGAPVRLGEFAGIPIHAPPGTALSVECDADGRWLCRVGPFLVLGPVDPGGL